MARRTEADRLRDAKLKGGIGEIRHVPSGRPRAQRAVPRKPPKRRRRGRDRYGRAVAKPQFGTPRMATLRAMGFASYKSYLRSDLWYVIRAAALARRSTCIRCNNLASQVHHSSYAESVMRGEDTDHLHPVCEDCHRFAEFIGDKKASLKQANQRLGITTETAAT